MSKLRLSLFLSLLFVSCQVVSASYSFSSSIYTRDGNSTLTSETFTFARPSSSYDPNFSDWVTVVCLDPQNMTVDECDMPGFGRCPNGDVSGILVRVSAYLVNLLLGIVIMYDPKEASGGVWAQLLTVYSLVISAIIAIYTKGLTRFHSAMTVFLVLSPLSFTLGIYAALGFLGRPHRLDSILSSRREHLLPRLAVIGFWLLAITAVVITNIFSDTHFTPPPPCDSTQETGALALAVSSLIYIPYAGAALLILAMIMSDSKIVFGIISIPLFLLVTALVVAVIRSRGSLSAQVRMLNIKSRSKRFWAYWELFGSRYPFLHFSGVFLIPMIYWVILNELLLFGTADNIFSISFGQVLAVFVVLHPLLQVLMMFPRASRWFSNLAPIRLMTGRRKEFIPITLDLQEGNQEMVPIGDFP
ncbi:hypothetical protein MSAN_02406800 [Mycena sanguinolenta]|uniref:Uncharacterized protein n=1 Tax=Mycena sanguinolenta TaxID=230812 RepID=A0A8H6X3F9_9AGAR|nr:hypothetical protein MSAN_02406800 [Mycena sanguinolenta]